LLRPVPVMLAAPIPAPSGGSQPEPKYDGYLL
jgi:hypothetical protein